MFVKTLCCETSIRGGVSCIHKQETVVGKPMKKPVYNLEREKIYISITLPMSFYPSHQAFPSVGLHGPSNFQDSFYIPPGKVKGPYCPLKARAQDALPKWDIFVPS